MFVVVMYCHSLVVGWGSQRVNWRSNPRPMIEQMTKTQKDDT